MNSKINLSELQKIIFNSILSNNELNIQNYISEKKGVSGHQRIAIYQKAYQIKMLESLKEDFPLVLEKLGEDSFQNLVYDFIKNDPSTYQNLSEYSQNFPQFLKKYSKEIYELASIEWIEIAALHSPFTHKNNLLSLNDILSGKPYKIILNSTLKSFSAKNYIHIAYRVRNEVSKQKLNFNEFELLKLFSNPIQLDELTSSDQFDKLGMNIQQIQNLLTEWIKNEILICEPT